MPRPLGSPNKETAIVKALTEEFFTRILSDAKEEKCWTYFLSPDRKDDIRWRAFERAVEYKRGQPIRRTDVTSNGRTVGFDVPLIPGMEQAEQRPNVN